MNAEWGIDEGVVGVVGRVGEYSAVGEKAGDWDDLPCKPDCCLFISCKFLKYSSSVFVMPPTLLP